MFFTEKSYYDFQLAWLRKLFSLPKTAPNPHRDIGIGIETSQRYLSQCLKIVLQCLQH